MLPIGIPHEKSFFGGAVPAVFAGLVPLCHFHRSLSSIPALPGSLGFFDHWRTQEPDSLVCFDRIPGKMFSFVALGPVFVSLFFFPLILHLFFSPSIGC